MNEKKISESLFGAPTDVLFCKSCVISNQRPSSTVEFKHDIKEKKKQLGFKMTEFVMHATIIKLNQIK